MSCLDKKVFIPAADKSVFPGFVSYMHSRDNVIVHRSGWLDSSDTYDNFEDRISKDNGETWSAPESRLKKHTVSCGSIRYVENAAFLDEDKNNLLTIVSKRFYPNEKVCSDQKLSLVFQLYDANKDKWQNSFEMDFDCEQGIGISFCFPIKISSGKLLIPAYQGSLDQSGRPVVFKGDWETSVSQSIVIIGECSSENNYSFRLSEPVTMYSEMSCRGCSENTLVELQDGRIAMVLRGSNSLYPQKPGYKWVCYSEDEGQVWSTPVAWACGDGTIIESSASGSALLRSIKNGKIYWIGNLCLGDERPNGNTPRTPLYIAEVSEEPFGIIRESIKIIDQKNLKKDDGPFTQLSNFRFYQDRDTGDINLFMTRFGERYADNYFYGNYYKYKIIV